MTRYVVLLAPSSNRVYAGDASRLCVAELAMLASALPAREISAIESTQIAGVPYVQFDAAVLERAELDVIANLSGALAFFETDGDRLRPIAASGLASFDDDLLSIPKYAGKTNEQFTKLLLNVTIASTSWSHEIGERRFSVLDPLAGRGTTLSQALTYGFDAAGVEVESREVEAYATFVSTYLKRKRIKHTFDLSPIRRDGKRLGTRLSVEVNGDADAFKRGDRQTLTVFSADTMASAELFGRRRFDVIVTDAPYGITHGSRADGPGGGRKRSAADLLAGAIPVWTGLLRRGGALGIGWNTLGLRRDQLVDLVTAAGLAVVEPQGSFEHRVDSSIVRDVLVAHKPD